MKNGTYLDVYGVIWGAGAAMLERSGSISAECRDGKPIGEHHLLHLEHEAKRVIDAVAEYRDRDTVKAVDADPVLTWPRPSYHGNGASRLPDPPGMRAAHMLPTAMGLAWADDDGGEAA
jgi:hypothetical protein